MMPFASLIGAKEPENIAEPNHVVWTAPGTYSWTVPEGVFEVCGLCVGSGGNSRGGNTGSPQRSPFSGGGADLRWANKIPVRPGEVLTIVVAEQGGGAGSAGFTTSIKRANGELLLAAIGGQGAGGYIDAITESTALGAKPDGRFVGGGTGAPQTSGSLTSPGVAPGGGGAGGYSGDGGQGGGGQPGSLQAPTAGTGGAGGGGEAIANATGAYSGGGVGIYGEGASGRAATQSNEAGSGGSAGGDSRRTNATSGTRYAGSHGAGAGGYLAGGSTTYWEFGGPAAARILWGKGPRNGGRAFPASNVSTATT